MLLSLTVTTNERTRKLRICYFLFFFLRFRCTHSTMLASAFFRKITSWKTTKYILGERHCFCLEDRGFSRSWRGSSMDGHLRLGLLAFIYQALLIPSGYGYGIPRFIQAAFFISLQLCSENYLHKIDQSKKFTACTRRKRSDLWRLAAGRCGAL